MIQYTKSYPVTADSIDIRYRLSPSGVILFLQDAIASDMATWHAAAFDIAPDNLLWVVLEYDISFKPIVPLWSDIVEVVVSVTEITAMKVFFDFSMIGADNHCFASGTSVWSLLDSKTRMPYMNTHDFVLKKSSLDPSKVNGCHPRKRFKEQGEPFFSGSYRIQRSDVDFNGHVSNRTYLPLALGCFSEEFLLSHAISALNVRYLKETYLDDTIEYVCRRSDSTFLCDMRSGAGDTVCQIVISWVENSDTRDVRKIVQRK